MEKLGPLIWLEPAATALVKISPILDGVADRHHDRIRDAVACDLVLVLALGAVLGVDREIRCLEVLLLDGCGLKLGYHLRRGRRVGLDGMLGVRVLGCDADPDRGGVGLRLDAALARHPDGGDLRAGGLRVGRLRVRADRRI